MILRARSRFAWGIYGTEAKPMYVLARDGSEGLLEASLGGRVTLEEMKVFGAELAEACADFGGEPFVVLLDTSAAAPFDLRTRHLLFEIKDMLLGGGALQITHVVRDDSEAAELAALRYEQFCKGVESYVTAVPEVDEARRAA
ncbi:MAG: hypothetical protein C4341_03760 [Armatimonadota bacterium]